VRRDRDERRLDSSIAGVLEFRDRWRPHDMPVPGPKPRDNNVTQVVIEDTCSLLNDKRHQHSSFVFGTLTSSPHIGGSQRYAQIPSMPGLMSTLTLHLDLEQMKAGRKRTRRYPLY